MSEWFRKVSEAWAEGEPIDDNTVDVKEIDLSAIPQEAVFIAILVAIATSIYLIWRMSDAIGKVITLLKDALWFIVRLTITLTVLVILFNYVAPDDVRREAGEFTMAVCHAAIKAPWYSHTSNLVSRATYFFQNLTKQ